MTERRLQRNSPALIGLLLACAGAVIASISTVETIKVRANAVSGSNFCTIGSLFDCYPVYASDFAAVGSIPVAFFGFLYFSWMIIAGFRHLASPTHDETDCRIPLIVTGISAVVCLGKAVEMTVLIGAVCLLCVSMYVIIFCLLATTTRNYLATGRNLSGLLVPVKPLVSGLFAYAVYCAVAIVIFVGSIDLFTRRFKPDIESEIIKYYSSDAVNLVLDDAGIRIGDRNAPVEIVEFIDFQCPYCLKLLQLTGRLHRDFPKETTIVLVNYPLDAKENPHIKQKFHDYAGLAARTALCAADRGELEEFEQLLFRRKRTMEERAIMDWATTGARKQADYGRCIASETITKRVRNDIERSRAHNVTATPVIYLNGREIRKWYSYELLRRTVLNELSRTNKLHHPRRLP
jgi:protein-disulfide isomerase/uncharacterized membrane protein